MVALIGLAAVAASVATFAARARATAPEQRLAAAAALPGQGDDDAGLVVNATSGWLVRDIDLRRHASVRKFLRGQNITDETDENKAILAEYAKEKQNFAGDRPGAQDDFEADEKKKPSRADDENNPMKPTLDRMKRKKRKELGADDKDKIVQSLLQRMGDALNEDKEALNRGEPATAKVKLLPLVGRLFKQRALRQTLLEYDALDLVREWLTPNKGVQPMLAIRTALLEAMSELPAQPEHLKRSGIGRIVMKMANNKQETRDNRTMARNLVEAWARPVVGKVGDMKSLEAMTARRAPVDSQAARVDHNQDDAGEIFEREGEESKNRARVRVPQFNGFAFTVRPASTADPARSKGKRAPKADSAQGRLHKRTKKR